MTKDDALKLLEKATRSCNNTEEQRALDVLMKEALAQPEQEPVAYTNGIDVILAKHWTADYPPEGWNPLGYTTPPKREWVGLTDEEHITLHDKFVDTDCYGLLIDAVEAKLKEKNK